ncbi:MAG: recombinase family protein [Bryobacteraceae bacterium]
MSKITAEHLSRTACVYVRQSTAEQLRVNQESRRLQYALRERAKGLGWHQVTVIDEDLGRSGSGIARPGFERLLASVCRGEIGAVLSIEASRLARNGRDWHTLLEFCALVNTLIIDTDGIYDPRLSNDRLLLGMKGTMSEMELALLRQRSQEALKIKAQRGELFTSVAIGYLRTQDGDRVEKDPDTRIREAIQLVFHKFEEFHTVRQVHLWLLQERIDLPRAQYEDDRRTILWLPPRYSTVLHVLTNPIYAGAYTFGRTGSAVHIEAGRKVIHRGLRRARAQWDIVIEAHHEGYISWEQFEHNQRMIAHNTNRRGEAVRGAVRRGEALLAGLVRCQHCGHKLHVTYVGRKGDVSYVCRTRFHNEGPQEKCLRFGAHRVDAAVATEVLKVIQPEGLRAAVAAIDTRANDCQHERRQIELAVEEARFEAQRAKRQYDRVDPDNRLVASELERRWNQRLQTLRDLEEKLGAQLAAASNVLTDVERGVLLELGGDVERAWSHPGAGIETRKHIIRAVLHEVVVLNKGTTLELALHWQGGDHTQISVARNRTGETRWKTSGDVQALIEVLARQTADRNIAAILNRSGKRTSHGHTWTDGRVRVFRNNHQIPVYRDGERAERGEVTLDETAHLLDVDRMRVYRLITAGVIAASHLCSGAPWIIKRAALDTPAVRQALRAAGGRRGPVTTSPDQQSLDISNT